MFLNVHTKVVIRREALRIKQQIKVTLTHKLKILLRYLVKFSAKAELFLMYFRRHNLWYLHHGIKIANEPKLDGDLSHLSVLFIIF